ncbi:tripartite tricarboxylate transporter permease [Oceanobacillus alkalisoli]|uniref:tripartite tricarboxylate transporter permease n=1 Tax=Oceanobacillus alkalisoli TaxID=2925113 RepID=UPI001EEFA32C|nr:tripartite tricarboxylate transporter permease [Oceanobacillus alkalisoli]MCF3944167.1 tripartite tricarboxylate transporter permease [Oceanobacillus alkalisoli]MCG5102556.1 tripartite tricarboxylate transporter permease [Oceanobacillus alkalisoli]
MDPTIIMQMILAGVLGAILYTIIGIAPGTDETAVLAPVTIALALLGLSPHVILAFFISAIVAKKLTDSIPVAIAGIPGGVMAAPMVEHAMVLKQHGLPDVSIRKMASGSVIGTLVSLPVSLLIAYLILPVADTVAEYAGLIFTLGAIFLALLTRNKILSLAIIVPFAMLIMGLRHLYWGLGIVPEDTNVFVSFFLGITIGPIAFTLFELLNKKMRKNMPRVGYKEIDMRKTGKEKGFPNPFKILTKKESITSAIGSLFGTITFFLTPVGMTVFWGELITRHIKDPVQRASRAISTMDGLTNATYIAGTLIPLIAIGLPLSPMAIGPAAGLFNAPPVFTPEHNIHHLLSIGEIMTATIIGAAIALAITFFITIKFSTQICAVVFKYIPHEALIGLFAGLVVMLAYMDAGVMNIFGTILVALVAGLLYRNGVNYGVMFMVLYAAPWMLGLF